MKVVRNHNMTAPKAIEAVDSLLPGLENRFAGSVSDVRHSWKGNTMEFSFKALGFNINGQIRVTETQVALNAHLPLLVRPMAGKFQAEVERELDEIIARAFRG